MIRNRVKLTFNKDDKKSQSRTQQQYKKEANINNIMARYNKTGILGDPLDVKKPGYFGDFSDVADFMNISNRIALAQNNFQNLPSDIRAKFGNDVSKLLDYVADPANAEQARKMGLLQPLTKEEIAAQAKIINDAADLKDKQKKDLAEQGQAKLDAADPD